MVGGQSSYQVTQCLECRRLLCSYNCWACKADTDMWHVILVYVLSDTPFSAVILLTLLDKSRCLYLIIVWPFKKLDTITGHEFFYGWYDTQQTNTVDTLNALKAYICMCCLFLEGLCENVGHSRPRLQVASFTAWLPRKWQMMSEESYCKRIFYYKLW